jgi:hypothetical protein
VLGFVDQQMNMLRHDHVSINAHGEAAAHVLQTQNKQVIGMGRAKVALSAVATEGEEVGLPGLLETSQTAGHKKTYTRPAPEYSEPQVSAQKTGANLGHPATKNRSSYVLLRSACVLLVTV